MLCHVATLGRGLRVEFEWDEEKRLSNIDKHKIDFLVARVVFDGRPFVDFGSSYELEVRVLRTAILDDGRLATVVWTRRDANIRIISARRAHGPEERTYRQIHHGGAQ